MNSSSCNLSKRISSLILGSAACLLAAGCGLGSSAPVSFATAPISGIVHGGPNPVQFSTITLWETQTSGASGYGSTAKVLATTTTNSIGYFQFTGSYTCDSTEYAYLTSTGGYTGSSSPNPNSVEVAAIGACPSLSTSTNIFVSEISTVAAAYALGPFISENSASKGTGNELVYIGAPQKNAAVSPSCTGVGAAMTCTAGGLGHAFSNALKLVDAVRYSGTPTGLANTVPSINGATVNTRGVIPQALINTLGNVLQSCVNSTGGTAGDSTACGKLFTDTTVGSNVPNDTLLAVLNIAKNPTNNVPAIAALATPISFFTPSLNAAPTDFSLAITYDGVGAATFGSPQALALDAADNVYTVATTGGTSSAIGALTADGAGLYVTSPNSTYFNETSIATDSVGNVWTANNSATAGAVLKYKTSSGSLNATVSYVSPYGLAVDQSNNVYFTQPGSGTTVQVIDAGTTTAVASTLNGGTGPTDAGPGTPQLLAFDASQDLFTTLGGSGNTELYYEMIPVVGPFTCTLPDFCAYFGFNTASTTYGPVYSPMFDASGNTWTNNGSTLYETNLNTGTYATTQIKSVVLTGDTGLRSGAMDGSNTIFLPESTTGSLLMYSTASNTTTSLSPCYAANGSRNCASPAALQTPANVQVDSTGAVWVSDPGSGRIVQILGVAAPAWPALSYAHPGVTPQ
jgi:hypothetical protein